MLPFGVTIPATVPQRSEIPEGLMNNPVYMKSRRMRWAGLVVLTGREQVHAGFWRVNLRERSHLGDPGIDKRIILRWIFRKWDVGAWTRSRWLRTRTGSGYL